MDARAARDCRQVADGALIVLHVAAALWHQVVRRDGFLRRMGFGINR
jgi:cytochrome b561